MVIKSGIQGGYDLNVSEKELEALLDCADAYLWLQKDNPPSRLNRKHVEWVKGAVDCFQAMIEGNSTTKEVTKLG